MSPHGPRMVGRSAISGLPEPQEKLAEGLRALKGLGPYLWPRDSIELRVRVGLILAYGLARLTSQGFNELRNGVFAKVAQRAVRRIALSAFRHIHSLS